MKRPEEKKKKPEMAELEAECAVAMCTETATRTLIKNKFQARVCPCHHRFVYDLPFLHRCQYTKHVVNEVILQAQLVYFQPGGSPTAQPQEEPNAHEETDFADTVACCENRATRVVFVGDELKQCNVYLFCHEHNAQVRAQSCEFAAKASAAKNEPYMSGALDCPDKAICTSDASESPQCSQPSPIEGSTSGESIASSTVPSKVVTLSVKHPDRLPIDIKQYRRDLNEMADLLDEPGAEKLLQFEEKMGRLGPMSSGQLWLKAPMGKLSDLTMEAIKQLQQEKDLDESLEHQLDTIMAAHRERDDRYRLDIDQSMGKDFVHDQLPPLVPAGSTLFDTREDRNTEAAIRYYIHTWNAVAALHDRQYWPVRWLVLPPVVKVGTITLDLLGRWYK
ncbi:hypothetical protein PG984_009604 [Apiospora sp. TS-2023a]